MRGSAWIYDVRMAQFVLKTEKLSHIIAARGSQDLRSPSPIMALVHAFYTKVEISVNRLLCKVYYHLAPGRALYENDLGQVSQKKVYWTNVSCKDIK